MEKTDHSEDMGPDEKTICARIANLPDKGPSRDLVATALRKASVVRFREPLLGIAAAAAAVALALGAFHILHRPPEQPATPIPEVRGRIAAAKARSEILQERVSPRHSRPARGTRSVITTRIRTARAKAARLRKKFETRYDKGSARNAAWPVSKVV